MYVTVLVRAQYFAPTPSISAPFAKKHVKTRLNHKIVRNLHSPRLAPPYLCKKNQMKFTTQDIINENLERRRTLTARATAYDPITGERSAGGDPFPFYPFNQCSSLLHAELLMHCGSKQPATASGVAIIYVSSLSGHVADTPVGSIPGFARLPPPAGVANYLASGHHRRSRSSSPTTAEWRSQRCANRHLPCHPSSGSAQRRRCEPFPFYPFNPWC